MSKVATLTFISDEENPDELFVVELDLAHSGEDRMATAAENAAVAVRLALNSPEFLASIFDLLEQTMLANAPEAEADGE